MTSQLTPDDPAFRDVVVAIVDDRLDERVTERVKERVAEIGTKLDQAGYPEAARFVRTNFGG